MAKTAKQQTATEPRQRQSTSVKSEDVDHVLRFKKRMLQWPNPVEYVNNMYGCHPDDDDNEYFKVIFAK